MKEKIRLIFQRWWFVFLLVILLPVYWNVALLNQRSVDYVNNGFFTFWLGGRTVWTGAHPYSSADWVGGHHANGATWIPNKIFPYPLPLTLILAPLGLLPINQAYILWDFIAQTLIGVCILWLASRWEGLNRRLYALVVLVAMLLNGNLHLGLMTGTIAALLLAFLTLSLYFFETKRPFWGGAALALLALKPPLLTVALLIGLWLLLRRDWRALLGGAAGGLALLVIGLLQDAQWVSKFLGAGENLLAMRVGNQPTILSYTRLACGGQMACALGLYALAALILAALYTWLLWKHHSRLTPLLAFSLAIPPGVLLPPYLWSYDYTLLVIPICMVAFELVRRRSSYLHATLFLLLLDLLAIIGLTLFWMNPESPALTIQRDMWSIWTAIYVLAVTWWLILRPPETEKRNQHVSLA